MLVNVTGVEDVLAEAIWLEGARMLLEVGEVDLATQLAHRAGDKGLELLREFKSL